MGEVAQVFPAMVDSKSPFLAIYMLHDGCAFPVVVAVAVY